MKDPSLIPIVGIFENNESGEGEYALITFNNKNHLLSYSFTHMISKIHITQIYHGI